MARKSFVPLELRLGPFSLVDAQRAGLTPEQLRSSPWRRVGHGIYVWVGLGDNPTMTLAAVHRRLPKQAAFSGLTAAWLHGLDVPPCDPVEVTIPAPGTRTLSGAYVHVAELPLGDMTHRRGLPVTSILRTMADLGRTLALVEAVAVVDAALHARLISLTDLQAYAASLTPRKGTRQLRRVVDHAEPAAESPMETRLRMLLVLGGLPRPQAQVRLYDEQGRYVGRPDLYYPDRRLGIEYDGDVHRGQLTDDNRRQNRLVSAGYRLLRFTAPDMRDSAAVIAQVRAAGPAGPGSARLLADAS